MLLLMMVWRLTTSKVVTDLDMSLNCLVDLDKSVNLPYMFDDMIL